jgi:hypothetical protein
MDKNLFWSDMTGHGDFSVQTFCGFHETIKHCFSESRWMLVPIPKQ